MKSGCGSIQTCQTFITVCNARLPHILANPCPVLFQLPGSVKRAIQKTRNFGYWQATVTIKQDFLNTHHLRTMIEAVAIAAGLGMTGSLSVTLREGQQLFYRLDELVHSGPPNKGRIPANNSEHVAVRVYPNRNESSALIPLVRLMLLTVMLLSSSSWTIVSPP